MVEPFWFRVREQLYCATTFPVKSTLPITVLSFRMAPPRHTPVSSFFRWDTPLKPLLSIRDLAWPSVKLFAPATGAVGLGGVFGVLTAGVLASLFANFILVCAIAGMVVATNKTAIIDLLIGFSFFGLVAD